jgi:hypothetical protein
MEKTKQSALFILIRYGFGAVARIVAEIVEAGTRNDRKLFRQIAHPVFDPKPILRNPVPDMLQALVLRDNPNNLLAERRDAVSGPLVRIRRGSQKTGDIAVALR